MTYNLTVSGNEITDPSRQAALAWALGQQGGSTDGLGLITNLCTNGGFESNTGGWGPYWSGVLTRVATNPFLGSFCLQVDTVAGNTHTDGAQWAFPAGLPLGAYTLSMYLRMPVPTTLSFGIEGATVTDLLGRVVTPGTDWQRFTITCTVTAWNGGVSTNCKIKVIEQADTQLTFFVDCVQLEFASTASNYVETNGAVGLGIQPGQGIAVWEAGTNLFRRGQCDSPTDWLGTGAGGNTLSLDATSPAPFSPQSLKEVADGTTTSQGVAAQSNTGQAAAAGVLGVGSVWFKGVNGASYECFLRWTHTDASVVDGTLLNFNGTGAWQLLVPVAVAVTALKTGDKLSIFVRFKTQRAETFWAAHAMLQAGPTVASPYVATSAGVTASRAAARVQAPSYLLDETQAWVALRVRPGFPSTGAPPINGLFSFADSNNTRLVCYIQGNGTLLFARQNAGAGASISAASVYNAGDALTIVCAWQAALQKISVNGVAFTSGANSSIPVLAAASFDIGSLDPYFAASELDGTILWLATGLGVLSDADAAALAALPGTPTGANFPTAAQLSSLMAMTTPTYAPIVDVSQNRRAQSNYSSLKALGYSDEMATAVASRIAA